MSLRTSSDSLPEFPKLPFRKITCDDWHIPARSLLPDELSAGDIIAMGSSGTELYHIIARPVLMCSGLLLEFPRLQPDNPTPVLSLLPGG